MRAVEPSGADAGHRVDAVAAGEHAVEDDDVVFRRSWRPRCPKGRVSRWSVCAAQRHSLGADGGGSFGVVFDDENAVHAGGHSKHDHVGVKDICPADRPDTFRGMPRVEADVAGLASRGLGGGGGRGRRVQ